MTRTDAVRRLKRLIGPKFHWQEDKRPSSPEARASASTEAQRIKGERDAAKLELEEMRRRLLSDPDYQALSAKVVWLNKELDNARWAACHHRIDVGTLNEIFFMVKAHGDNWADVVRKVEAMQAAKVGA